MNLAQWFFITVTAILVLLIGFFFSSYWPLPMASARDAVGEARVTDRDGRLIEYYVSGTGAPVMLIASVGREASDFNELVMALNEAGYRTLAVEAPGIGRSALPAEPITLWDLADDVAAIAFVEATGPVFVIGHAFGNRVARAFATRHGARGVVTLAAGGKVPIADDAKDALLTCFKPWVATKARREAVRTGFFAEGNAIPDHWMRGWHGDTLQVQAAATQAVPADHWWGAGDAPLLVVQAGQDTIAPKAHTADLLVEEFGGRVTVVDIDQAGHALLPEQPGLIAQAVTRFLDTHRP